MDPRLKAVSEHWSRSDQGPTRTRWWQSPLVVSHINRTFCGKDVHGTDGGDIELLRRVADGRTFSRAVSVGCGNAHHEIQLLRSGVVENFDLFEITEARAEQARARADAMGVGDRAHVMTVDAFSRPVEPAYDLVYWKDALHHMFDARAAVRWSLDVLVPGGVFFMNEFVGPTLMQYSDRQLDLAERIRAALPERYLLNPHQEGSPVPLRRARPDLERMKAIDPSECADSGNILPALRELFPDATVIPTGGIGYFLALNDILANFDEAGDAALLSAIMLADDLCAKRARPSTPSVSPGSRDLLTAARATFP
jgi:SAM-dependent methyltransferase